MVVSLVFGMGTFVLTVIIYSLENKIDIIL